MTKTASMTPSLNAALDNHVGLLSSLTVTDVVFTTDSMSGTVHLISLITNTIKFLKAVGDLYKAFLVF